jgi:hypothetical protein
MQSHLKNLFIKKGIQLQLVFKLLENKAFEKNLVFKTK